MKITVVGAQGLVGRAVADRLHRMGHQVSAYDPRRGPTTAQLGHVIYTAGVRGNFAHELKKAYEAHVEHLSRVALHTNHQGITYISSARLYKHSSVTAEEELIRTSSLQVGDYYNVSKLMGEALVLHCGGENSRVVRLSNVVGDLPSPHTFLHSLIESVERGESVMLSSALESSKDYITLRDVVDVLTLIAVTGEQSIYNLASGVNISNLEIINILSEHRHFRITLAETAANTTYPQIDISRIQHEFAFEPHNPMLALKAAVSRYFEAGKITSVNSGS